MRRNQAMFDAEKFIRGISTKFHPSSPHFNCKGAWVHYWIWLISYKQYGKKKVNRKRKKYLRRFIKVRQDVLKSSATHRFLVWMCKFSCSIRVLVTFIRGKVKFSERRHHPSDIFCFQSLTNYQFLNLNKYLKIARQKTLFPLPTVWQTLIKNCHPVLQDIYP